MLYSEAVWLSLVPPLRLSLPGLLLSQLPLSPTPQEIGSLPEWSQLVKKQLALKFHGELHKIHQMLLTHCITIQDKAQLHNVANAVLEWA